MSVGTIDEYLAGLDEASARVIAHVYDVALDVVPDAVPGTKYAMAALVHADKGLIAVTRSKNHVGLHPFSGHVLASLSDDLVGFDHSPGTLRFSVDAPPPDELVRRIVERRRDEIDGR